MSGRAGTESAQGAALLGAAVLVLLPVFYYPLASVFSRALVDEEGRLGGGHIIRLISDPYIRRVIGFTFAQAALSTLLSVVLGLPGAWILARAGFRGRRIVRAATTIPFVLPSILVVLGFVLFFGRAGVVNRLLMSVFDLSQPPLRVLYTLRAILLAHAFYNFPICARIVAGVWERANPHVEEAARSLGASGPRLFLRVVFPQILPGILSAGALIFLFCLLSFAVILVLGGGPRFTTIEVEVYRLARTDLDLARGGALALVGTILSMAVLSASLRLRRWASPPAAPTAPAPLARLFDRRAPVRSALIALYGTLVLVVVAGPIATVIGQSLMERRGWAGSTSLSIRWYVQIFQGAAARFGGSYRQAVVNSLAFGAATALLSVPFGALVAWAALRKRFPGVHALEVLVMLPMGVSPVILGLAYLKGSLPVGRAWAVVVAHTVIAYLFVVRAVGAVLHRVSPSTLEAARALGAGTLRTLWHVELPLARGGLVTGAAFAFAISMGEINATLLLSEGGTVTVPIAIYRLIGSYNFFAACAMGTILIAVALATFLLIDRTAPEAL